MTRVLSNTSKIDTSSTKFNENILIQNWQKVNQRIVNAIKKANRLDKSTRLIAVSKTKPVEMIDSLAKKGQQDFGENYLQEAIEKITRLSNNRYAKPIIWHYIGHIQRNKTSDIAENFDWVHTVERDIIAKRLNNQRPDNLPPLNILIQVNIDEEASKSGCQPDELMDLVQKVLTYPNLTLRGLMIIPSQSSHDSFTRTQNIFKQVQLEYPENKNWDTLSMGMSNDLESAIIHGSTMVRIGTSIFGSRNYD